MCVSTQQCVLWMDVGPCGKHWSVDGILALLVEIAHWTDKNTQTMNLSENSSTCNKFNKKQISSKTLDVRIFFLGVRVHFLSSCFYLLY